MKVNLLYRDRDFDAGQKLPWNAETLIQDLELNTLFNAMAQGDEFLFSVTRSTILSSLRNDINTILYRQQILRDCLKNPVIVHKIYDLAVESIQKEKENYLGIFSDYPDAILSRSMKVLQIFIYELKRLRAIADEHSEDFNSEGFRQFFKMLKSELTDAYFEEMENHLSELKFRNGILISAMLGEGNKGKDYVLRKFHDEKQTWWQRMASQYVMPWIQQNDKKWLKQIFEKTDKYTFYVNYRDESGLRALRHIKDEGINLVANTLAQSDDHILNFFIQLKTELAYYLGCLNLHEQLTRLDEPVSFSNPEEAKNHVHSVKGLYDVCLALTLKHNVVGNDMEGENRDLFIVTGANQGGKSTFLRSVGVSQLMMQSGMFTPAASFRANVCDSLVTHFKREEDVDMKSGKLDEELNRMDQIIQHITPNSIVLFNESFGATNEREGSEIADQIVKALLEKHIKIFFVTHLFEFAYSFHEKKVEKALFLRAQRREDGTRTFKITEGAPSQSSFGNDIYHIIFDKKSSDEESFEKSEQNS